MMDHDGSWDHENDHDDDGGLLMFINGYQWLLIMMMVVVVVVVVYLMDLNGYFCNMEVLNGNM
jgi:hypothetical protein